jgi:hypothetical protein
MTVDEDGELSGPPLHERSRVTVPVCVPFTSTRHEKGQVTLPDELSETEPEPYPWVTLRDDPLRR